MESFADKLVALTKLLAVDAVFVALFVAVIAAIAVWKRPAYAVLKRNFVSYFTSPTGYVFLCIFVWLSAIAAFWTDGFFNANLANLDQLNRYFPLIMLVFIPAITMSIWAEERRQGTDELLLTIPADDFDIVLGKYLAAVAIYTASLLFSQIANYIVLINLGDPDVGLFLGNYFGYWMVGLAMLAIGMVASFLTANLTVGFILGAVFCSIFVLIAWADVLLPDAAGRALKTFSISEQFKDLQGGVISFGSVTYFVMTILVMLYLCMVLIGRRHWSGGKDGKAMGGHYLVRVLGLLVIAASASVFAESVSLFRKDVTSEKLSSISDASVKLIQEVTSPEDQYLIKIEAFLSSDLPEEFVQKRFDLLSALREIKATGGEKISLRIHDQIDLFSDEANRAETLYGIEKQTVETKIRGATASRDVIFGVAFESGLERAVIPFMGESLPIEYELIRSLASVTQQERMTVGVLQTDADLMGASSFTRPGRNERPLVEELRKQYEVVSVDPSSPITDEFDVLLAVQPSSLDEQQMKNFVDAVRSGQPTAIFEDPFPLLLPAPGTSQPKRPAGQMAMFQQQPQPKGDISQLWDLLGVKMVSQPPTSPRFGAAGGDEVLVVWQDYNPHPEDAEVQNEWVWISPANGAEMPFNEEEPTTSGLQKLLLLYPGGLLDEGSDVGREFVPLIMTGATNSGTVSYDQCLDYNAIGQPYLRTRAEMEAEDVEKLTAVSNVLGARIRIKAKEDGSVDNENEGAAKQSGEGDAGGASSPADINVIFVADIDVLSGFFFELRERNEIFGERFARWQVDNVPLVLNILDQLAEDDRFIDIRKRRRMHRELTAVQRLTEKAKKSRNDARKKAAKKFKKVQDEEEAKFTEIYKELEGRTDVPLQQRQEELAIARRSGQDRIEAKKAQLDRQRDEEYRKIENTAAARIHQVQDVYKMLAVFLPPIPPLLVAIWVFFVRRRHEREGVAASRRV